MKKYILILTAMFLLPKISLASGIDCKHAQAQFDKMICGSPFLMQQDRDLTTAYDALEKKLSPEAQDDLKRGQKTWLTYVRKQCNERQLKAEKDAQKICGDDAGCVAAVYDNQSDCIGDEYSSRTGALQDALKNSKNGFLMVDNTLSGIFPPLEEDSGETGNAGINISYPQIYIPYSEGIKKWNAAQRQLPHNDRGDDDCQHNSRYTVNFVTPHFISFAFAEDWYCKSMAHPNGGTSNATIKLPSGEMLEGSDMFKPGVNWKGILTKIVSENLKPEIGECPGSQCSASQKNLKDLVSNNWMITPSGLTITINPYEITSYAGTPDPIEISWEELNPYLRKDFLDDLLHSTK